MLPVYRLFAVYYVLFVIVMVKSFLVLDSFSFCAFHTDYNFFIMLIAFLCVFFVLVLFRSSFAMVENVLILNLLSFCNFFPYRL